MGYLNCSRRFNCACLGFVPRVQIGTRFTMEINLPTTGCNVYYGTYFDNYNRNVRRRYYFDDNGSYIQSNTQYNYNGQDYDISSYTCIQQVPFRNDLVIVWEFMAFIITACAFGLIYKVIIKRLLP